MSTKHAAHLATCVATIAFALALAFPAFVHIPLPWYHPAERMWSFEVHASGVAIDFYGRCMFAALVSVVAAASAYAFGRRVMRRDPSPRVVALFTVWAVSLTVLVIAFYTWRVAHRTLTPPPVPSCTSWGDPSRR
jgi:hypothetical protein